MANAVVMNCSLI